MNRKSAISTSLVAALFVAYGSYRATAQLVISIDMDTSLAGVQSTRIAGPGESFSVGLVFDLTGTPDGVSSYGVSVRFDNTELLLNDPNGVAPLTDAASELLPAGFAFNLSAGVSGASNDVGGGLGQVSTFEAATLAAGPTSGTFSAGTVAFTVQSPVTAAGIDITPGLYNAGVDGLFNNSSGSIGSVSFVGGSVIPEPSTYALVVGGVLFGWAVMRKARRGHND